MNTSTDFEWPKALRAIRAAAEAGTLEPRHLYPIEVKALCELVAGVPLSESPREVAPDMVVTRRAEYQGEYPSRHIRAAYFFICRFEGGRVWQCSLFTDWIWEVNGSPRIAVATHLSPRNIVRAVTRSIIDRGPK